MRLLQRPVAARSPARGGERGGAYDLSRLNPLGWLLVTALGVAMFAGLLLVGVLTYQPKRIAPVAWAACAGVFFVSLLVFRLADHVLTRCGLPIRRGQ